MLAGGLGVVAAGLAGCLGGARAEPTPTPVDLSGEKQDDEGGMVIGMHGGPNGQLFYERPPTEHGNPAWFHTLVFGLFPFYLRMRERGREPTAAYATDYSTVAYELPADAERPVMPAPTAPGAFGNARELTYVHGSRVRGGMGPTLVPFSEDADARSFLDRYGGERAGFDAIDRTFLANYGRTG